MNKDFAPYLARIEEEIHKALPKVSGKEWQDTVFGQLYPAVTADHISPLITPTRSLVDLGGKRWRPLLLVLTAQALAEKDGGTKDPSSSNKFETACHLTPLVEFTHTASLIHDDIEDSSDTRRGKPAAYITYGLDTALNAGSWLYFAATSCIDTLSSTDEALKARVYALYNMELRRLHLGQAMDIAWHRNKGFIPSPDEYLAMVQCKTGTLASLAVKLGCMACKTDDSTAKKAGATAAKIGAGFQIIDDVINLSTGNPGKKRGDDIVEGKKSLPVLLFAQSKGNSSKEFQELESCFEQAAKEGINSPAVEKAIGILEGANSIAQAKQKGVSLIEEGCAEFADIFGSANKYALLIQDLFRSMVPANI
ncbi:MAG TPA: polyprenyl synthetase family protein [Treponema sp.]|nr:polyprenyl synthetase family protein [Treponema sp.]